MKIERLNVGWFTAPGGIFRKGHDLDHTVRFPVPAYVIETATERILVDTGLNPEAIADPGAYYERPEMLAMFALEQEQSVAEQVDVATLTKVVLTQPRRRAATDPGVGAGCGSAQRVASRPRRRGGCSATCSFPVNMPRMVAR